MPQINDKLLDPLLEKIVMGKPLAKALITETYRKIEAAKSASKTPVFREIMNEVVRQHSQELRGADDFRKANCIVSQYFSACKKIREEKERIENNATEQTEQVSEEKHSLQQLEMFQSDNLKLVDKKQVEKILIEDYLIDKYYHKRP